MTLNEDADDAASRVTAAPADGAAVEYCPAHRTTAASSATSSAALLSTARDRVEQLKNTHLQGISDLTLRAPIKQGLINALDTRTYETRLRHLMRALHALRVSSREYSPLRPFVDTAARIRTIHSLRLAIIDQQLLLAVTFDRPWEPYIRSIWGDVGALLDLIFCNCDGYTVSTEHSFDEYMQWVRTAQVETGFFFSATQLTVDDLQYLQQLERIYDEAQDAYQLRAARETLQNPCQLAAAVTSVPAHQPEIIKQGMLALAALYRLADMYTPQADGEILLRAAHELLKGLPTTLPPEIRARFAAQLTWFEQRLPEPARPTPTPIAVPTQEIQAGILSPLLENHACLMLFAIDDAIAAARALSGLLPQLSTAASSPNRLNITLAFTHEGLCQLGLRETELQKFAAEFREGMQARAGLLGDVRCNHPRNWRLPERNWPTAATADSPMPRIELQMVHVIIQLGLQGDDCNLEIQDRDHPLHDHVAAIASRAQGMSLLSVQATTRQPPHFGFVDGVSQPAVNQPATPGSNYSNEIPLGDVLLGYPNRLDFATRDPLLDNGSYLVVRKLRQHVQLFHEQMDRESSRLGISADELKAKLMGRTLAGVSLADPSACAAGNDFNYDGDQQGLLCPFAAHVRRANPRTAEAPRIVRRGMAYGPPFQPANPTPEERGLVFMAYNARIAEQFEVIQRWLTGGNSTGVYSGHADPFLGVPEQGVARTFRFQHTSHGVPEALHVNLTDSPYVTLEWGMYLFVPSLSGLRTLLGHARRARGLPDAAAGEKLLQKLLQQDRDPELCNPEAWKTLLEDFESRVSGTAANVWAAIREQHRGVLRTSYGVLVCSRELVMEVFANERQRYSATGYLQRMKASIGEIYLGKDAGAQYDREAQATNAAIQSITSQEAFELAYRYSQETLQRFIAVTKKLSSEARLRTWELTLDLKELSDAVLAKLSAQWFDVPDGKHILAGGWRWDWEVSQPPLCPGHFTAPSRYMFQPHPGIGPRDYGTLHGKALRVAMNAFVAARRADLTSLHGRLSRAMFAALPHAKDNDLLARNLVGVMMGFLPSVDGNLRATLYEWIEHRTLWEVQQAYLSQAALPKYEQAMASIVEPMMNTMRLRPVPELVWRTAKVKHKLAGVQLHPDDQVLVAIVSATQQDRLQGTVDDVYPIFGGNRRSAPARPHACPAYDSGMAILVGIIAGLFDSGPMRPTPAPLTLCFSGELVFK